MSATLVAIALAAAGPTADPPYAIARSAVTEVRADDGERYRLFVSWPDGTPPPAGWPVLYLLDGADHFATATETARRFARARAHSAVEPGVVVAIDAGTLPRRVRDYTPPSPGYAIPAGAPASGLATGGGDRFLALLADRIKPLVARRWRVDPTRETLAGHSFGGLIALHALAVRPGVADRYVAVSPSLWFGEGLIGREAAAATDLRGTRAVVAFGTAEGGPGGNPGPASDKLRDALVAHGAAVRLLPLPGQDHGSTMLAAMGALVTTAFGTVR